MGEVTSVKKHYLSANTFLHDSWRLAAQIFKSGWMPDYLIGLWRGGATVAIAVHEIFKAEGWDVQHFPLKCSSYSGIGENGGEVIFSFGEEIFESFSPNNRVLVIDDVFDTGKTAIAVRDKFRKIGAEMRFACVYWKSVKNHTDMKPDYYVKDVGDEWIVFPHEIDGLTKEEIKEKDSFLVELL